MAERVATRIYIPSVLVEGEATFLDPPQTHRARHVLRLRPGSALAAFNSRDGEFLCRVAQFERHRNRTLLAVETRLREPEVDAGNDPWLVFSPIKRLRLDWLIEKGTELGVAVFVPVATARTEAARVNRERLRSQAIAAVEQSERLSIPEIRELASLPAMLAAWPADRRLVVCDVTGGGAPIAEALAGLPSGAPAAILIGPEGGFTQTELDALANLPFVTRAGLGPRVLRAETAALAAIAVFQAIAGDGRRGRPG